ncbi:MAG: aminotransferase class I/II-fold pyridoxal phosphate-dependent enzyme [Bdellovibrionota bacterium]|nr:MAG: aminotransferase class I/II-fold pyridoxal phosphate-dependent enzyme [Bdellovibrionota bacterium]
MNYPNNPLGCTVSRAFWERISLLAERFDFLTINDFVYGELGFAQPRAASIFSSAGAMCHAVEIYSLSKCLSVPDGAWAAS